MRGWLSRTALIGLCALPLAAPAQEDDRSYLVAFLEDNLSDAGRKVTITGFAGALSSVATLDELTIADDDGVWITLRDVSLDWSRSAVLSGEVLINALTAAEIVLDRMPVSGDAPAMPALEGTAFSLPELPVSINIGKIEAASIQLGETILGEAVEGRLKAAMTLIGGEGQIELEIERLDDGPDGFVYLDASYANATGELTLSLDASEAANGIAVRLLSVPGAPSAQVTIDGSGPLDDFTADIALITDDQPRLAGTVALFGLQDGARSFSADLAGDLAPVFWPEYKAFLGDKLTLSAKGVSLPDGRFDLSEFDLTSAALKATGNLSLAPDGLPERFAMNLAIADPTGAPLLLPLTTELPTRLVSARLNLGFDAANSDAWTLGGLIMGLERPDFSADSLSLSGGGNIARGADGRRVSADLSFIGFGLKPADAALATAIGQSVSGKLTADWVAGSGQTEIRELSLSGDDYSLNASGAVQGLETGFAVGGRVQGDWADLSRLSDLAGLPLGGRASMLVSGQGSALGDAFDLRFSVQGDELRMGQPEVDALLSGASHVSGHVSRGPDGTLLRDIVVAAGDLRGTLNGTLTTDAMSVTADVAFPDLAALGPGYRGSLSGDLTYIGSLQDGIVTLNGKANGLGIGQAETDKILAGPADLAVTFAVTDGTARLQDALLDGQSLNLTAKGSADGTITVAADLANLGLILPEFPGAVTLSGPLRQTSAGTDVSLTLEGPAQVSGTLTGTLNPGFGGANLVFSGQSLADVANPILKPRALSGRLGYDLRLSGPLALSSLNGQITLSGGRLADPSQSFGIEGIEARADISGGQARITAASRVSSGGTVSVDGSARLEAPFQGALQVDLQNVLLRQPRLYETVVSGALSVDGPLAGGALISGTLDLGRTELRVPSSGLTGAEAIPEIIHVDEPFDVRITREKAGLIGQKAATSGGGGSGSFGLDITLRATNQIFLRGRGLDAELGGSLRLRGTTAEISPQGSFDLIRGRLDLVGRRLVLTQAQLMLQGEFIPRIDIVASIEDTDIISTIRITGPASDPKLTFESSPELPDEEVLAQLLFGERLQSLSAFQAVQLATAVRTLAGIGGEGLVGKIRGKTGLDNLDITTGETGESSVTAGKYLSEKVYSEVTVDQTGRTQIELNLDVRSHITLKGKLDSNGDTGIGIFLEKNY